QMPVIDAEQRIAGRYLSADLLDGYVHLQHQARQRRADGNVLRPRFHDSGRGNSLAERIAGGLDGGRRLGSPPTPGPGNAEPMAMFSDRDSTIPAAAIPWPNGLRAGSTGGGGLG